MSDANIYLSDEEKQAFLASLPFYSRLSGNERALLSERLLLSRYPAGSSICSLEAQCLGTVFVKKGILRLYLLSGDGREATICRLRDGEVCLLSASCLMSAVTFDVQIEAETDCELYIIPSSAFAILMNANIFVENFAYKSMTERFSDVVAAMERMFFARPPGAASCCLPFRRGGRPEAGLPVPYPGTAGQSHRKRQGSCQPQFETDGFRRTDPGVQRPDLYSE